MRVQMVFCSQSLHICSNPWGDAVTRTAALFFFFFFFSLWQGKWEKLQRKKSWKSGALAVGQPPLPRTQREQCPQESKCCLLRFREPAGPKSCSILSALSFWVVGTDSRLGEQEHPTGGNYC